MVIPYEQWFSEARRAYLVEMLRRAGGNQCKAANLMQLHRNTVKRMIVENGITPTDIRAIKLSKPKTQELQHV